MQYSQQQQFLDMCRLQTWSTPIKLEIVMTVKSATNGKLAVKVTHIAARLIERESAACGLD
jgi:hypothetical protein